MRRLEWLDRAVLYLESATAYVARRNPDAAERLRDLIQSKVLALPDNPELYRRGRLSGTREMVVHPSYLVIYSFDATCVTILRVLHSARKWP